MVTKTLIARSVFASFVALGGLVSLLGAGCTPQDESDLLDILHGGSPISPTGTGGHTTPATTTTATPTPITASISASKASNIIAGENITFTANNVQGGTPPYAYFWIMDTDAAYTLAGPNFTRQIDGSALSRTVTLVVRDSTNTDSQFFSLEVTLEAQLTPAVNTVCGDMSGVWGTTYGVMTLTQVGSDVAGTYDYFGCIGTISGTLTLDPDTRNSCPSCMRWEGSWTETGGSCSGQGGSFQFSVDPDLGHFNGRWSKDPNTHWQADFWSGNHNQCGDGSDPSPRP